MAARAFRFTCRSCDEVHEGIPAFGPDVPYRFDALEPSRRARSIVTRDQCLVPRAEDDVTVEFHLRGELPIPVHGLDEPFVYLVWVSLSLATHERICDRWDTVGRERDPPYAAALSTALPYDRSTLDLEALVHSRPVGRKPRIEVRAPADHPLVIEQRQGLTIAQLEARIERLLHDPACFRPPSPG